VRVLRAGGAVRLVDFAAAGTLSFEGVAARISLLDDVTERQLARVSAEHADRLAALGALAASVAHEINNPLTVLSSNLEALRAGDDAHAAALDDALAHARRIRSIIADLRAFSRDDIDEALDAASISRVVSAAMNLVANELRHLATVRVDVPADLHARAHDGPLVQVLVNLLLNASHASLRDDYRVSCPELDFIAATATWAVLCLALVAHTRGQRIEGVVAACGGTLLAFAYLGAMLGTWLLVRTQVGPWVLAGAILTVKASDIGAYFTGMSLGRHKMIPWLSPGKSWEGLAGGIAFAAAVGGLLAWWSGSLPDPRDQVPVVLGACAGAVLGLVGPFGDLAESLLKRNAGAKDSGNTLPGMGGLLDVVDSPLLAGPVVWWALQFR
jgi:phosphatidate cytidylyltransferase